MIGETDRQLVEWAKSIVPDLDVDVAPPSMDESPAVHITLLSMVPVPAPRTSRRPPRELILEYLVTTSGGDVPKSHDWLGTLAFAAMDVTSWKVSLDPLPLDLWNAFHIAPRPAFVVRVPLRVERPEERAPLVRHPLVVEGTQTASLAGDVFGPDDTAIAGAKIEVPALQLYGRTDENGSFHFPTIPADRPVSVVIRARGQVMTVRTSPGERLRVALDESALEG
ncbi:MAG: carboxypeptidase-like regulatory domain-containing protein [Thermoanaerobaculia bacterium]